MEECADEKPPLSLSVLPSATLLNIVTQLPLRDAAACMLADRTLREAAQVALRARISWHTRDHHEVSHMKASRLFKFLARYSPNLARISCCFASDRLYGGSLLESSLGCLAGCTPGLTHLTLLNVDVTDVVLQHFARHCPSLQHVAIGRTGNNAFGNFVSDEGLAALAAGCRQLTSLNLFRCYSCSDAGLRELAAQGRQLTSLVLHSCPQVTAAGLVSFLESTPGLLQLDVLVSESGPGSAAVNFEACFALAANCSKLRVLRLSEELVSRGVLDDACLAVIGRGCTALQELELVQVEVSDSLMAVLASHCSQLTSLRLEQTYVGDEGVQRVLAGCPGLRELRVAGCSTHSWMLPAEFMFAGLSVAGLSKLSELAADRASCGAQLTSLDLSCVALHQPEAMEAAAAAAAAAGVAVAAGAAAAVAGGGLAAAAAAAEAAKNAAAGFAAAAAVDVDEAGGNSFVAEGAAGDLMNNNMLSDADSNSSSSSLVDVAQQQQQSELQALLLFPQGWCNRLTSLSLDGLKVDGIVLQAHLAATLQQCPNLTRLSLVGYQGSVDDLLQSAASTGAALSHLNLQHSQVSDAGLSLAAAAFPKLVSIYLCYCRNVGDHGLLQLLDLPRLEELDLYNTPCVSAAAVAKLARYCSSLQRLYVGHSTSALHRLPATAPAMSYISGSSSSSSNRFGSSSSGSSSSVWGAVNEAANCRRGGKLAVLCRNPSSESEFEKRTLQTLMASR